MNVQRGLRRARCVGVPADGAGLEAQNSDDSAGEHELRLDVGILTGGVGWGECADPARGVAKSATVQLVEKFCAVAAAGHQAGLPQRSQVLREPSSAEADDARKFFWT